MAAGDNTDDMIATVMHRLGDPGFEQWTEAEIVDYLNSAQREVIDLVSQRALHEVTMIDTITLVGATSSYALPSDFGYPLRVVYKEDDATLWPIQRIRALRQNAHHEQSETNPYAVIWDNKVEFFVGGVTQSNGDTASLWYIAEPTAMAAGTTDMDFGNHLRNLIEQGTVARAYEQADVGNYDQAEYERGVFEFLCQTINLHYGKVPSFIGFPRDPVLNPEQQ